MRLIPLLLIPILIAHGLVLAGVDLDAVWLSLPLPSAARFELSAGTALVAFALLMLLGEVYKATSAVRASFADHGLSLALFVVLLLEFLLWGKAGNSTFFLLLVMTLADVLAGFAVGLAVARRDVGFIRE
jgi:hypothetical protein